MESSRNHNLISTYVIEVHKLALLLVRFKPDQRVEKSTGLIRLKNLALHVNQIIHQTVVELYLGQLGFREKYVDIIALPEPDSAMVNKDRITSSLPLVSSPPAPVWR